LHYLHRYYMLQVHVESISGNNQKMLTIINRYIFREIIFPFFMCLFIFTFVLLMGKILQLMDLMINKGISIIDITKLILYLLPSFLLITIPISLLISILIALGRLSADSEIIIMKSSGISLYQMLLPIGTVSLCALILTAVMGVAGAPYGNYATRNLVFDIAKKKASVGIKEKIFNDDFHGLVLYAEKIPVHGDFMEGVFISDNRLIKEPTTIIAQKGYLVSNPESMTITLRLKNGSTHAVNSNFKSYKIMDFSSYDINLDLSAPVSEKKSAAAMADKKSKEMSFFELAQGVQKLQTGDPIRRQLIIEFNKKMTIPLSCIIFGILGIPLGIGQVRSGKSRGFTIGLFVITIYYVLQLSGEALGETGKVTPALGAWAPDIILGFVGIYMLVMAARERPPRIDFVTPVIHRIVTLTNRGKTGTDQTRHRK
jgi:lipopolysaccharide export system permease protein